jgi:hypothetical protein
MKIVINYFSCGESRKGIPTRCRSNINADVKYVSKGRGF